MFGKLRLSLIINSIIKPFYLFFSPVMDNLYYENQFYQCFGNLIDRLQTSGKLGDLYKVIDNLKTNNNSDGVYEYFSNIEEVDGCLSCTIVSQFKSEEKSLSFRKEGNIFFKHKLYGEALNCYNGSIIHAYNPSLKHKLFDSLALGYAKRSGVLYELNQYDKCLSDIRNTKELNVQRNLLTKLILRESMCLIELQRPKEAEVLLQNHINCLINIGNFSKRIKLKIYRAIEKCQDKLGQNNAASKYKEKDFNDQENKIICENPQGEDQHKIKLSLLTSDELILAQRHSQPPQLLKFNPNIPSFSDGITIHYTKNKERHVIATKDIKPGDLVAVDIAYSTCIRMDSSGVMHSYCCVCFTRTPNPTPCPQCTMVVFCSESCKVSRLSQFHNIECSVLPTFATLGAPNCAEVFKLMTKTTFCNVLKRSKTFQLEKGDKTKAQFCFNENTEIDSSKYETVFDMVTNFQKRSVLDLIKVCSEAYIITDLLRQCGKFFTDENGECQSPSKSDLVLAGEACFTLLLSTLCNSFELSEYLVDVDDMEEYKITNIGRGSFPSLALLNHSCNPSTMVLSNGITNTCHAVRFIPKGAEVTISYGKLYYKHDLVSRRNYLLHHYFFTCLCEACVEDWQTYEKTKVIEYPRLLNIRFLELKHDILIDKANLKHKLHIIIKTFEESVRKIQLDEDDPYVYVDVFVDLIVFFDKYVELPNIIYFQSQKYLAFCKGVKSCPCKYFKNTY